MEHEQLPHEAVDVADWFGDEEFAVYPEGARDKTLLSCPTRKPYHFLRPGHRYLFKRSSHRYEEQFWVEIFAYRLGKKINISVPPAFVAHDSKKSQSGALIEWFLKPFRLSSYETFTRGGDYCQQYIPDFDRKKGGQHNFETVVQIFNDLRKQHPTLNVDWKSYWSKIFVFDALIGNTDRHQDNWGIIENPINKEMCISPIFDNGTSMGHEIYDNKFELYDDERLKKYIEKGTHHIKWKQSDAARAGHVELLQKIVAKYPVTQQAMLDCLRMINYEMFKNILDDLVAFDVPVRLSVKRADFMLKLLQFRHQRLLSELEKSYALY